MDVTVSTLDEDAMAAAYDRLDRTHGKLDGLAVWLAGVRGDPHPRLDRVRVVAFGDVAVEADAAGGATFVDGRTLVGREVDEGADAFVLVAPSSPAAAALVAGLVGAEPVDVVAAGPHWAREVGEVRDALRRHRDLGALDLAEALGLANVAGFVIEAARRRTPVLLDGLGPAAAALAAVKTVPRAAAYLAAGHVGPDPAQRRALEALRLEPLLDLGIRADGAALLALPLLRAAAALLDERG